ncbi:methyl-accepting chemotaxis protein [Paenibacillus sp. GCM10027626]|uniref:methyl-accepting chemotaxis protein n=1 Tax=Paenibacillus sp. GCM10027626 TaxID=3273411 RepID=UPI00362805B8
MKISSWLKIMGCLLLILSVLNIFSIIRLEHSLEQERTAVQRQAEFKQLGIDLIRASDYLSGEIQYYVQFGEKAHYDNYWNEVNKTKTRDHIIEQLIALGAPKNELDLIEAAKSKSDALVTIEEAAMKAVEAKNFDEARKLIFGEDYKESKNTINGYTDQFVETMNKRVEQETAAAQKAVKTMMNTTVILLIITFVALFGLFILISFKMRPLSVVNAKIAELASNGGDLTARLPEGANDEVGEISRSLNHMLNSLHLMIKDITSVSHSMLEASGKLSVNTNLSAGATDEISRSVNEIRQGATASVQNTVDSSRAIEEMATGVQRVAGSASELSASAMETEREAEEGFGHMEQAKQQMLQIDKTVHQSTVIVSKMNERSSHIQEMADTIAQIAKQTNLLSLNASIEAARAGEHGRGFVVVAGEIRKLAEGSATSAAHIAELLKEIREDSTATVQVMNQIVEEVGLGSIKVTHASGSFQKILNATREVSSQIQEVSAITQEMAAGSEEIAASVADMASVAQQSLENVNTVNEKTGAQTLLVQEVADLSHGLRNEAEQLEQLVGKFKI